MDAHGSLLRGLQDSVWFVDGLKTLLEAEDTICLALVAIACDLGALRHQLLDVARSTRPLSTQELVQYAAERGYWSYVAKLQWELPRSRLCVRGNVTEWANEAGLAQCQWIQQHHPIAFKESVLVRAAERGNLAEVQWLHRCTDYDANKVIQCAAKSRHRDVVQWLLDHHDTAAKRGEKQMLTTQVRLDQTPFGIVCWRIKGQDQWAYCFHVDHGLLPPRSAFHEYDLYPLMDWVATCGDLELLRQLHEHPLGATMCTTKAIEGAVTSSHVEIVEWLLNSRFSGRDGFEVAVETAAKLGDTRVLDLLYRRPEFSVLPPALVARLFVHPQSQQWLIDHRDRTNPIYWPRLIRGFVEHGLLDSLRYACTEFKVTLQDAYNLVRVGALKGHYEVVRWIIETYLLRDSSLRSKLKDVLMVSLIGGSAELVRYLVDELHVWSRYCIDSAVSGGRIDIAKYLYAKANERALADGSQVFSDVLYYPGVRTILRSFSTSRGNAAFIQWILEKAPDDIPQADEEVDKDEVGWFVTLQAGNPYRPAMSWTLIRAWMQYQPSLCRQIPHIPRWVVKSGTLADLHVLEALKHPHLFIKATLDSILKHSRNDEVLSWFLTNPRAKAEWLNMRVVSWAARYGSVELLSWLKDKIIGPNPAAGDHVVRDFLSVSIWSAVRHDQVTVFQWISRQPFPIHVVENVLKSRVGIAVARGGKLRCLLWLCQNVKMFADQQSELAGIAAQYGHLLCLKGLSEAWNTDCTLQDLLKAARRGHMDVVDYILSQQPRVLHENDVLAQEVLATSRRYRDFFDTRSIIRSHKASLRGRSITGISFRDKGTQQTRDQPIFA